MPSVQPQFATIEISIALATAPRTRPSIPLDAVERISGKTIVVSILTVSPFEFQNLTGFAFSIDSDFGSEYSSYLQQNDFVVLGTESYWQMNK